MKVVWARVGHDHHPGRLLPGLPAEGDFEFGKDCFGLDQSQVRLYTAIVRHTVLVMAALAACAVTAVSCATAPTPRHHHPPGPASGPTRPGDDPADRPLRSDTLLSGLPWPAARKTGWIGAAATKPAPAGTTNAEGSPAMPQSPWSASEWLLPN